MDTTQENNRDLFAEVKDAFSCLELDQKATFLITESVNTAVEAVSTLVDVVAKECTQLFSTDTAKETAESEKTESSQSEPT